MIKKIKLNSLNTPIVLLLLSSIVLDSKINFAMSLLIFLWIMVKNHGAINYSFPGNRTYFLLLLVGIGIGLYACVVGINAWYILFKQIFYFLRPFIYWHLGYMLQKLSIKKNKDCLKTVVIFSFFFAVINIIRSLVTLINMGGITSVYLYRESIGLSGGISFFGFVLLLYFYRDVDIQNKNKNLILITTLVSLLIHFSRTSIIQIFIFIMFMLPFSKMKTKFKTMILGIMSIVVLVVLFPNLVESFVTKSLRSFTEMGFTQTNWNELTINNNWRGFEAYSAINQFNNSSLFTQLFGNGFGFKLDLGGYASLVTDEEGLIFLHNGYFTNLMLWGVTGFLLFIIWCINGYRSSSSYNSKNYRFFVKAMFVMFMVCTYFVNGPFFSLTLSQYFLLLGIVKYKDRFSMLEVHNE